MVSQKTVENLASQVVLNYLDREIEFLDIAEMEEVESLSNKDLRNIHSLASGILAKIKSDYQIGIKVIAAEERMDAARTGLRITRGMNIPEIVEFFAAQEALILAKKAKNEAR